MTILLLTTDLMTGSQVEAAARQSGMELRVASSADTVVKRVEEGGVEKVILDLSCTAADTAEVIARLTALDATPKVIAFGPHVHAQKLAAAREAGCDQVLSRGQFFAQIADLLGV